MAHNSQLLIQLHLMFYLKVQEAQYNLHIRQMVDALLDRSCTIQPRRNKYAV